MALITFENYIRTFGTIHKPIRTMHKSRKFASIFNYKLPMKERYFSLGLLKRVASLNLCFEPTFEISVRIEILHVNNLIIQNIAIYSSYIEYSI